MIKNFKTKENLVKQGAKNLFKNKLFIYIFAFKVMKKNKMQISCNLNRQSSKNISTQCCTSLVQDPIVQ